MSNRYEVLRSLGAGGMAQVYLAKAHGEGGFEKLVAIKRILPELARIPETRELFMREAQIAPRLNHPHIVNVFDGGMRGDDLFLVLEFVDGGDVDGLISGMSRTGTRLAPEVVAMVGSQICQALSFLFAVTDDKGASLVQAHRDISPGNILIGRNGSVKLSDFGVVRLGESKTAAGLARGKWEYFPPELGQSPHDARGDLYALGVTLYQLATLVHPFAAESPEAHFDRARTAEAPRPTDMPEGLWTILARALQKQPDQRFQTPEEMSEALESFVISVGHPVTAQVMARAFAPLLPPPVPVEPKLESPSRPLWQPDPQRAAWDFMVEADWQPTGPTLDASGAMSGGAPRVDPPPARPQPLPDPERSNPYISPAYSAPSQAPTLAAAAAPSPPRLIDDVMPLADVTDLELSVGPPALRVDTSLPPEEEAGLAAPKRSKGWAVLAALAVAGAVGAAVLLRQPGQTLVPALASAGALTVFIDSKPQGAQVFIGDQLVGTTPLAMRNAYASGTSIRIALKKAGYRTAESAFFGGDKQDVNVTLQPLR